MMQKRKSSPVRALIDLKNHSPQPTKKTFKKLETPASVSINPPMLVKLEFESNQQKLVVEVDPRRDMQSILKELSAYPQLNRLDKEILRKQLLSQLQKTSSKPRVESAKVQSEDLNPPQEIDIIELTGTDIRFLRTVFDAIGTTKHGYIYYEDRGCQQLMRCLPTESQPTIKQLVLTLMHRRQPARFEDFVFLVCEEGWLDRLQRIFAELLN